MKLHEDYAKQPYSFLLNDTTLSSDKSIRFREKPLCK